MRLAHALAAAALTVGLAAGAPAAQADLDPPVDGYGNCQFSKAKLFDDELVVGDTHERSVDFYMRATDCGGFAVEGDDPSRNPYLDFGHDVGGYLYSDDGDPNDIYGSVSVGPDSLRNSYAGKKLDGTITLPDGTTRPFGPKLTLKRKTRIDVGDLPGSVKKNKKFLFGAGISRADWNAGYYNSYEDQKVHLQTSTNGGKYKTLKTYKSMHGQNGGSLNASVKIKKPTCFRWVYDGSSTTAAVTSDNDCVKIKK